MNTGPGRVIPLNASAVKALAYWGELSPNRQLDDAVFPHGWRKAWRNALKRAGFKIRFHDLRHTAITRLAESQVSDQTLMSIAGHVSRAMLEQYSYIRLAAKHAALDSVSTPLPEPKPTDFRGDVHQSMHQAEPNENQAASKLLN